MGIRWFRKIQCRRKILALLGLGLICFWYLLPKFKRESTFAQAQDWKRYPYIREGINFPQDEGNHPDFNTEWWYLNFYGQGDDGKDYAGVVTFARAPGTPSDGLLLELTEETTQHFSYATDPGVLQLGTGKLAVNFLNAFGKRSSLMQRDGFPFQYDLTAEAKASGRTVKYHFQLDALKPPLVEGGSQKINIGQGIFSYYYSLTRLALTGRIELDGRTITLNQGLGWLDHQWFQTPAGKDVKVNHEWFSLQLDNNYDAVYFRVFNPDNKTVDVSYLGLLLPDGTQVHSISEELYETFGHSLRVEEWWAAEKLGKKWTMYHARRRPWSWQVAIATTLEDQLVRSPQGNVYEGGTKIEATSGEWSGKVGGRGFAELTHRYPDLTRGNPPRCAVQPFFKGRDAAKPVVIGEEVTLEFAVTDPDADAERLILLVDNLDVRDPPRADPTDYGWLRALNCRESSPELCQGQVTWKTGEGRYRLENRWYTVWVVAEDAQGNICNSILAPKLPPEVSCDTPTTLCHYEFEVRDPAPVEVKFSSGWINWLGAADFRGPTPNAEDLVETLGWKCGSYPSALSINNGVNWQPYIFGYSQSFLLKLSGGVLLRMPKPCLIENR